MTSFLRMFQKRYDYGSSWLDDLPILWQKRLVWSSLAISKSLEMWNHIVYRCGVVGYDLAGFGTTGATN